MESRIRRGEVAGISAQIIDVGHEGNGTGNVGDGHWRSCGRYDGEEAETASQREGRLRPKPCDERCRDIENSVVSRGRVWE